MRRKCSIVYVLPTVVDACPCVYFLLSCRLRCPMCQPTLLCVQPPDFITFFSFRRKNNSNNNTTQIPRKKTPNNKNNNQYHHLKNVCTCRALERVLLCITALCVRCAWTPSPLFGLYVSASWYALHRFYL